MRPRGWHLLERHLLVDGQPVSASLIDFGLHLFHNGRRLVDAGSGPYFYLPKLESHLEARLWNEVLAAGEERFGLDPGTIRATVLIETIPAAFEMEEILYELREHSAGLNAGRWDYIFSMIKCFRERPEFVLPDRQRRDDDGAVHARLHRAAGAHLPPPRRARDGRDDGGDAVPHRRGGQPPGAGERGLRQGARGGRRLRRLLGRPSRLGAGGARAVRQGARGSRPTSSIAPARTSTWAPRTCSTPPPRAAPQGISEQGLRSNVNVGIQYISSWLRGNGAAAIYGLMEDAATAEISRSQVWQWIRHGCSTPEGERITPELVKRLEGEELERIRGEIDDDEWFEREGRPDLSRELFEQVALSDELAEFLTVPAYEHLD